MFRCLNILPSVFAGRDQRHHLHPRLPSGNAVRGWRLSHRLPRHRPILVWYWYQQWKRENLLPTGQFSGDSQCGRQARGKRIPTSCLLSFQCFPGNLGQRGGLRGGDAPRRTFEAGEWWSTSLLSVLSLRAHSHLVTAFAQRFCIDFLMRFWGLCTSLFLSKFWSSTFLMCWDVFFF